MWKVRVGVSLSSLPPSSQGGWGCRGRCLPPSPPPQSSRASGGGASPWWWENGPGGPPWDPPWSASSQASFSLSFRGPLSSRASSSCYLTSPFKYNMAKLCASCLLKMQCITHTLHIHIHTLGVCVDDGWFKLPHLDESDWALGLGEAAQLLHIEKSMCTG